LAFLDEEQQKEQQREQQRVIAPEEPERPRRHFGGPERRRQQFLLRRLLAVGVFLGFLILIVVGIRGCLEARSDRGLRNYTQDVSTIMQESEQRGSDFFELVDNPGTTTELQFQQQVQSLRGASQSLLDRAESISVPGQMKDAQSSVVLALRLRRDALGAIGDKVTEATADQETSSAIETITQQMGSLYASDVLWTQIGTPEIDNILQNEGVEAQDLPAGNFMPESDPTQYLDQTTVVEKLSSITGGVTTSGTHGLGLLDTTVGDVTLTEDSTTDVPDDAKEIDVQVQNQGESDESQVEVSITLNGEELRGTIEQLAAGEADTVKVPITTLPQPGTETSLDVIIKPVSGESVTDNNQASYTVVFGSSDSTSP
jgi:hypothetical protein